MEESSAVVEWHVSTCCGATNDCLERLLKRDGQKWPVAGVAASLRRFFMEGLFGNMFCIITRAGYIEIG